METTASLPPKIADCHYSSEITEFFFRVCSRIRIRSININRSEKTWRNGNCEFISFVYIQWGCFVLIWNTYHFENCAHRSPKWLRKLQWYYSDESPSFAYTLHLWSICTCPKWLFDWSARENNETFYGEMVMYALVNISHPQGGYSGFQVTGMIEWSQKSRPKKILRASSKTQKNPWTKN